jgi:hypothetical protein
LGDEAARAHLVAHQFDAVRTRANEDDASSFQRTRKRRVFRQEAVTGMQRLCPNAPTRFNQLRDIEVGRHGRQAVQFDRLVSLQHGRAIGVHRVVGHHGGEPHALECVQDPQRDLATVGDQNFLKHGRNQLYGG